MERLATSQDVSEAQRKAAQAILDGLAEQESAERSAVRANNRSPMQRWRAESADTPAKMQQALENIATDGLDALNDGITDAIMNAKDLGEVFSQVSRQIIADLVAIGVRRSIGGEPREVQPGVPLAEGENELWAQRANMEAVFLLGDRITMTADQLGGVFLGCHFLAADLLERLPRPPEENPKAV